MTVTMRPLAERERDRVAKANRASAFGRTLALVRKAVISWSLSQPPGEMLDRLPRGVVEELGGHVRVARGLRKA